MRADLVALGRPHLTAPAFTQHAAAAYGVRDLAMPEPYRWGMDAALRTAARDQADLRELKLKARPKSHAPEPLASLALPEAAE